MNRRLFLKQASACSGLAATGATLHVSSSANARPFAAQSAYDYCANFIQGYPNFPTSSAGGSRAQSFLNVFQMTTAQRMAAGYPTDCELNIDQMIEDLKAIPTYSGTPNSFWDTFRDGAEDHCCSPLYA